MVREDSLAHLFLPFPSSPMRYPSLFLAPAYFGPFKAAQIATQMIQDYTLGRLEQKKGHAPATINRELAALKRMFNLGARTTPPKVERVPYVPMLKEDNVRKGFFEHEDYLAVRDSISEHLKDLMMFGYKTGRRVSEITGLTWAQVDLKARTVRLEVGTTKNDEGRIVFMDHEMEEMFLRRWRSRRRPLPWVFLNAFSPTSSLIHGTECSREPTSGGGPPD